MGVYNFLKKSLADELPCYYGNTFSVKNDKVILDALFENKFLSEANYSRLVRQRKVIVESSVGEKSNATIK